MAYQSYPIMKLKFTSKWTVKNVLNLVGKLLAVTWPVKQSENAVSKTKVSGSHGGVVRQLAFAIHNNCKCI